MPSSSYRKGVLNLNTILLYCLRCPMKTDKVLHFCRPGEPLAPLLIFKSSLPNTLTGAVLLALLELHGELC